MIDNLKLKLITLDGPVAVGKSSVGRLLAKRLGFSFFDTGLMYRAFTWKVLRLNVCHDSEKELSHLADITKFDFVPCQEGFLSVILDGEDVSSKLFYPEIEEKVFVISKVAGVRQVMVSEQRKLARQGRLVMAGRDIGTVVLPWAELKIFLTASVKERAERRYKELLGRKEKVDYSIVLANLKERDENDSRRGISPLKPDDHAIIIDTDGLALEQVVDKICKLAEGLDD